MPMLVARKTVRIVQTPVVTYAVFAGATLSAATIKQSCLYEYMKVVLKYLAVRFIELVG